MITRIVKVVASWGQTEIVGEIVEGHSPPKLKIRIGARHILMDKSEWDEFIGEVERIWENDG